MFFQANRTNKKSKDIANRELGKDGRKSPRNVEKTERYSKCGRGEPIFETIYHWS